LLAGEGEKGGEGEGEGNNGWGNRGKGGEGKKKANLCYGGGERGFILLIVDTI